MPTRPPSPDPSGAANADQSNPFAGLGAGLGAGLDFFQDWFKAAGSALPNMQGHTAANAGVTPGMSAWSMPTLDPAELEKRIQDLKTVQFWLEQNARMVAMTIQGLEVQRMTLSTLQGMNVSMDALRDSLKARPSASAPSPAPAEPAPPASPFASAFASSPRPAPSPSSWTQRQPEEDGPSGSDDAPVSPPESAAQSETPDLINPMRWWDTLTQQFTHLASQAAQTVGDSVGGSMDMIKQAQAAASDATAKATRQASAHTGAKAAGKTSSKAPGKTTTKPTAKTKSASPKPARKTSARSPGTSKPEQP